MDTTNKKTLSKKVYAQKTIEYMIYGSIIIGIVLSMVGNNYQHKAKNKTSIRSWIQTSAAGYIMSAIGLLLMTPFAIKFNTQKVNPSQPLSNKMMDGMNRIIIYPLPIYITALVFILACSQILMFQDRLITKHVATEYYTWINSFSFLISVQTILLAYYAIFTRGSKSELRYVIYLIGLFNIVILGITQVILQFFSTDG